MRLSYEQAAFASGKAFAVYDGGLPCYRVERGRDLRLLDDQQRERALVTMKEGDFCVLVGGAEILRLRRDAAGLHVSGLAWEIGGDLFYHHYTAVFRTMPVFEVFPLRGHLLITVSPGYDAVLTLATVLAIETLLDEPVKGGK